MTSEYRKWWDFFQTGNNQHDSFIKWFSEHEDELPTIISMMSIGPGYGDVDTEIIAKSLTGLQSYIGVEPDSDNSRTLTATMTTQCPNVQVVPVPVGVSQGPSEPVDLVLAINVFYYIPDYAAVLQQLYSWVHPGGVLIIGHSHEHMYAGVAKEAGLSGHYWMSDFREDVKQAGLDHFKEYMMAYTVDMGSTFNKDMVRYFYKHNVLKGAGSEADVQKCVDIFKKKFESSDRYQTYHNGIILLERSA